MTSNPLTTSFIRALPSGDIEVEGYAALWGSTAERDCYGTWFDRNRPPEMGLDLLPVAYLVEHNGAGGLKRSRIGKVVQTWFDDIGIKYRAILDHTAPMFSHALEIIKRKTGFTSTGSAEHLARFDQEGRFVDWLLSEISLTEQPCEHRMKQVEIIRAHDLSRPQVAYAIRSTTPPDTACSCGCQHKHSLTIQRSTEMATLESLGLGGLSIEQIGQALIDQFGAETVANVYSSVFAVEGAPLTDVAALQSSAASAFPDVDPAALSTLVDILYAVITEMPDQLEALVAMLTPQTEPAGMEGEAVLAQVQARARRQRKLPKVPTMPVQRNNQPDRITQLEAQIERLTNALTSTNGLPSAPQPVRKAPFVNDISSKYDYLSVSEMATGYIWMNELAATRRMKRPVSDEYRKALAYRVEDEFKRDDAVRRDYVRRGYSSIRANELMGSTVANAGDEWVGVAYDRNLWEKVRVGTMYQAAVQMGMTEIEIPDGFESITIPTEGADPTWYKTGQTVSEDGSGHPLTKLDSSKPGTASKSLTVAKLGAAVVVTTELIEDSLIPILPDLTRRLEVSAQEQIEYLLINGDTDATINTNINLIDGTPTAATLGGLPSYLLVDGFLKLALVTNTANKFDMSGAPTQDDFLTLLSYLGTNGKYSADKTKQMFITDIPTSFAVLAAITNAQTLEKFGSAATLVAGELTKIWGRSYFASGQMALANTAGKISNTGSNNTKGRILCVRPDQWRVGWKRRTETKVAEDIRADATTIVTFMRWGLTYFDNEASSVAFNGTVLS